ncbi:MAG TPA: hypothetical protein VIL46_12870, partial [Gemmataceae bacterium]
AEGGTAPAMGFMLAYNLLSSSTSLDDLRLYARGARGGNPNAPEVGIVGGLGRKGAQKMVILETDGAPNTAGKANFVRKGPPHDNQSYFNVRVYDPSDWNDARNELPRPDTYRLSDLYDVVDTLVSRRDHPTRPGHATVRHPVLIHCIAYGTLFDPANAGATQSNALSALQTIQFKGNTAATTSAADFPQYKRIYGSVPDRVQKMKDAFTKIMQEGVSVSLLE